MAVTDSFLTFVLEQLDHVRNVTWRRMFGGVGLYAGERFFGLIDNDRLYFKVDDTTVVDYARAGMTPFRPDPAQAASMKYYEVPVSVLEDGDELAAWARRAVSAAEASARPKPRRRSTRADSRAQRRRGKPTRGRRR